MKHPKGTSYATWPRLFHLIALVLAPACGGTFTPDTPLETADAGPDQLAKQEFDDMVAPLMAAQCDSCHKTGAVSSPVFEATYESVTGYVPTAGSAAFLSCTTPASSFLITGATTDHLGPAWTTDAEAIVAAWVATWATVSPACNGMQAEKAVSGSIIIVVGANTVPLDNLGPGLVGATLQFTADEVGGGLLLDGMSVTAGTGGLHVVNPVFESCNAGTPLPDAAPTQVDIEAPPGGTVTLPTVALPGVPITAKLGVRFDVFTPQAGPDGPPTDNGGACAL